MPTEQEFRDAAARLRRLAGVVDEARRHLDDALRSGAVAGGAVATTIERSCEQGVTSSASIREQLVALAEQCERRAIVCAEHAAALLTWEARCERWAEATRRFELARADPDQFAPWPGSRPRRPVAPFEWVDPR